MTKRVQDYSAAEWAAAVELDRVTRQRLAEAAAALKRAKDQQAAATAQAKSAAAFAIASGTGKWDVARTLGVSRVTLDRWLAEHETE